MGNEHSQSIRDLLWSTPQMCLVRSVCGVVSALGIAVDLKTVQVLMEYRKPLLTSLFAYARYQGTELTDAQIDRGIAMEMIKIISQSCNASLPEPERVNIVDIKHLLSLRESGEVLVFIDPDKQNSVGHALHLGKTIRRYSDNQLCVEDEFESFPIEQLKIAVENKSMHAFLFRK